MFYALGRCFQLSALFKSGAEERFCRVSGCFIRIIDLFWSIGGYLIGFCLFILSLTPSQTLLVEYPFVRCTQNRMGSHLAYVFAVNLVLQFHRHSGDREILEI